MEDFGGQAEHAGGAAAPVPPAPNVVTLASGHTVRLHPEPTVDIGVAAMAAIRDTIGDGQPAVEAALARVYIRFGPEWWDFDEPITAESTARLLSFSDGGMEVAEAADALYSEAVMGFLARKMQRLWPSPPTPTAASTSASRSSGRPSPTRSARSSRSGTGGKRSGARAR